MSYIKHEPNIKINRRDIEKLWDSTADCWPLDWLELYIGWLQENLQTIEDMYQEARARREDPPRLTELEMFLESQGL